MFNLYCILNAKQSLNARRVNGMKEEQNLTISIVGRSRKERNNLTVIAGERRTPRIEWQTERRCFSYESCMHSICMRQLYSLPFPKIKMIEFFFTCNCQKYCMMHCFRSGFLPGRKTIAFGFQFCTLLLFSCSVEMHSNVFMSR